jgi:hypothetical protein
MYCPLPALFPISSQYVVACIGRVTAWSMICRAARVSTHPISKSGTSFKHLKSYETEHIWSGYTPSCADIERRAFQVFFASIQSPAGRGSQLCRCIAVIY